MAISSGAATRHKAMRHKVASAMTAVVVPVTMVLTVAPALAATPTPTPTPMPAPATRSALKPAVTLTVADNGRHVRVHRGQRIRVQLSVDPSTDPATWWRPIDLDGRALRARPQTLLAIRGTTLGRYTAVGRGKATLSSTRSVCPPTSNGLTCHAMQGWSVTVAVH